MRTKSEELIMKIRDIIDEYYTNNGLAPTIRYIAGETGISKSNVQRYLIEMEKRGILMQEGRGYQTERISATERDMVSVARLGRVPCGALTEEFENAEGYVRLPKSIVGEKGGCFLLTASGDSMIDAGISDGDLVLVRRQEHADYDDIIVALVENEVTLKRFRPDAAGGRVVLHPENKKMKDIIVESCVIQGVATKVIKDL